MTVDEAFGGNDALKALIEAAHRKGIKIILDGVFNHTGADSLYFNRYSTYDSLGAYQSKESPYYSWYDFQNFPNEYTCWWDIEILPRINVQNHSCSDFFVCKKGVIKKYADMGIDGFRLDVVDELGDNFIEKIKSTLGNINNASILYGEVWEDASNKIAYSTRKRYYLGSELDGVMNYPIRRGIIDYLAEQKTDSLNYALTEVTRNAPERIMHAQMNLLGTHDTERILTVLAADKAAGYSNSELSKKRMTKAQRTLGIRRLKLAYTILATLPGIPAIFYGDEAGLEGYGDPFNRMPYPWGHEDKDILDFYQKIGIIRRENDVYSQGEFILNHLDRDILVFTRKNDKIAITTVVNNSQKPISLNFSGIAKAQITPKSRKEFSLKPLSAEIYKAKVGDTLTVDV
jgi:glycosidase